jgi:splicing factor 45
VYIYRNGNTSAKVFVKFTSQLSALRVCFPYLLILERSINIAQAVNALEGRIFNGNTISAMFYNNERFEQGIYDL